VHIGLIFSPKRKPSLQSTAVKWSRAVFLNLFFWTRHSIFCREASWHTNVQGGNTARYSGLHTHSLPSAVIIRSCLWTFSRSAVFFEVWRVLRRLIVSSTDMCYMQFCVTFAFSYLSYIKFILFQYG
jgi:hypothetical protein